MSSDGSVSSRISQFGLYRTIDARTEEFLKLSKKRQIKQGCVCAAISTALTVTIVVTVLLIYEYNVIAEARRSGHKSNWFGLMNNSADDSNLLEILNKENIELDKTTLKLLPILLKALNQNRYTEKNIEEPSTFHTPYQKEVTTDASITKNIFADTRNWMKPPQPRLYTIEYKTSPIVYFKNPTRNIEYFTKIRKIRDYQRILNYVDKMISDKNYLGTTQPMKKNYGYTEKPFKMTTDNRNHKSKQKVANKKKLAPKSTITENKTNCKCSHKFSEIMTKLMNNIQQLLAYVSGSNSSQIFRCNNKSPIQSKPLKLLNESPIHENIHKMVTVKYNAFEPKFTRTPSYKTFLNRHKYAIDPPTKSFDIRKDHTVNAIMSLIKPNFNKHNDIDMNFELNEDLSTTNSYVKSLDATDVFNKPSGNSYAKLLNTDTKTSTNAVTTVGDYILQKGTYDIQPDIKSSLPTYTETDFSDEDDYTEATETTTVLANNLNRLGTYTVELVKSNFVLHPKNITDGINAYPFKGTRLSQNSNNYGSMRKMGNLVSKKKESPSFVPYQYRFAPILNRSSAPTTNPTKSKLNYKMNVTHTTKPTERTLIFENKTKMKNSEPKLTNTKQNHTKNTTSEDELEKTRDQDISTETTLKHIEEAIMILNNETTTKETENFNNISADTYNWKTVPLEENTTSSKSMMPVGRSTYLEIQRNDWRHQENNDFDNDMNYIFD